MDHVGDSRIVRLNYGYFVRPAEETGTGQPRVEPLLGYAVMHPQGTLLLDTGMGRHPDVDAHYRPRRVALLAALRSAGLSPDDITLIVNCHLHFDHCGGNPALPRLPIIVQKQELAAARSQDYTLPELIEAPGLRYEEIDGEAELLPNVLVIPTPGHTDGHQSVIVRQPSGTVAVLAGQSHDTAAAYGADVLAVRAASDWHPPPLPVAPDWVARLCDLDPARVYFAHDHSVWMPSDE